MNARHTVLVVDDDPGMLLLCRVALELDGHRVIEAADGVSALDLIRAGCPDVVVLDTTLPRLDGWQVLRAIKDDPALHHLPVVMLTAGVEGEGQLRGLTAGAAEYLTKPFAPFALSHVLEDVLATDPDELARRDAVIVEHLERLRQELDGG